MYRVFTVRRRRAMGQFLDPVMAVQSVSRWEGWPQTNVGKPGLWAGILAVSQEPRLLLQGRDGTS